MKNTALILAFIMCFVSYQGFARGIFNNNSNKPGTGKSSALTDEKSTITGGTNTITNGTNAITGGTNTITNGTNAMTGGTNTINSGNTTITGGKITVPGGSGDVKAGETGRQPSNQEISDRIPVTSKIVEFMLKNDGSSDGLRFYLSKPFTLKIYEQKETAEVEFTNGMVILNPPNPADEKKIEFTVNNEGKLIDIPGPDKGRELQILFQEHGKTLIFRRNVQLNCYELSSVKILDNRSYDTVSSNDPPKLYVHGKDNRDNSTTVQVIPVPDTPHNQQIRRASNTVQSSHNINISNDSYTYTGNSRSAASSRNIIASGSVTQDRVIAYAVRRNPALNRNHIVPVINEYFREANYEGVNVDFAIAQMLHATNFFRNQTRVNNNNFAGFTTSRPGNGTFRDMPTGVKAHIQHLKGYAKEKPRSSVIVDPRYNLAFDHGFHGIKFENVYSRWTASPVEYEKNIETILAGIGASGARY